MEMSIGHLIPHRESVRYHASITFNVTIELLAGFHLISLPVLELLPRHNMPGLVMASLPHHIELARTHYTLRHLTQIHWRCGHTAPGFGWQISGGCGEFVSVDILITDH